MTSEVKPDLKIELSDPNYVCSHTSLACKGFLEKIHTTMTTTGQLSFVDERCTLVKRTERRARHSQMSCNQEGFLPSLSLCSHVSHDRQKKNVGHGHVGFEEGYYY